MSLPIDPGSIGTPGNPATLCEALKIQAAEPLRQKFSVVGADIDRTPFTLERLEQIEQVGLSILDYTLIKLSTENDLTTTIWQNFTTGEEVTRDFYLAGSTNAISPFSCACEGVELLYVTQFNDPDYVDYVNDGINTLAKDLNDAYQNDILQPINPNPDPQTYPVWNGVIEEQYEATQMNDAITAYINDPTPANQAALNNAITTYEAYASQRNANINAYNSQLATYNSGVGGINDKINEYNERYDGYYAIGPLPLMETDVPEYQVLPTGLPPSPTPVVLPVQLSQYSSIEIPISSDVYLAYQPMNFFLEYPYINDPTFGLNSPIRTGIETYNNDYVITQEMDEDEFEQYNVNTLNQQIIEYNANGNDPEVVNDYIEAVDEYNDKASTRFDPTITDFNSNVVDPFNTGNRTIFLTSSIPPFTTFSVTIPESLPEAINLIIAATNAAISSPDFQYTPFPQVAPGVVGVEQRDPMEAAPPNDPLPQPGDVDTLDERLPYDQIPLFTSLLIPTDQYLNGGLEELQELPVTDTTGIPPITGNNDDPSQYSSINDLFDVLNSDISTYNTNQFGPESNAVNGLNAAIDLWNNSSQTQADLDALNAAVTAYNLDVSNNLSPPINDINAQVDAFNTGPPPTTNGSEYLTTLNEEITSQNVNREAYGITPMPLYSSKPIREAMPPAPVSENLTLETAPVTILNVSTRVEYPLVPEMTEITIGDNFIADQVNSVTCNIEDIVAITKLQTKDPDYIAWRDLLTSGGLNIQYNDTLNIYLEAGGAPWPSTTYFGVPPPPEPATSNLSATPRLVINEWINQVISAMPYDLGTNTSDLNTLQNAIDDYNAYLGALNGAINNYNASIVSVNEQVGIPAWEQEDDPPTVEFSTYGSVPPPDVFSDPQTITNVELSPPPPTTTQTTVKFVRVDQAGLDAVNQWFQDVINEPGPTPAGAQEQYDAYNEFVETSNPKALPNTLNGYATEYNKRYIDLGLFSPLTTVDLLPPIETHALLPSVTDPSVTGYTMTNDGTDNDYTQANGNTTITNFNAYQIQGFLYAIANESIDPNVNNTLDDLNGDITDYNTNGIPQEQSIISNYNDEIDDFNNTSSGNYFNALNDLQTASDNYSTASTQPTLPSQVLNSTIDQFNLNSLDQANNGSTFGPGANGFLPSANDILSDSGIKYTGLISGLSTVRSVEDMPLALSNSPAAIPNYTDDLSTFRPPYPRLTFRLELEGNIDQNLQLLPLYFSFEVTSIDPTRSASGLSDLDYIRENIYDGLVGIPYPDAPVSIIPDYNTTKDDSEGFLAENNAVGVLSEGEYLPSDSLNAAILNYNQAAEAYTDPGDPNYNDNSFIESASDDLKDAVEDYINTIAIQNNSVNENIDDLNAQIDEWTAALEDANTRLDFWGFPDIPEIYEINSRELMQSPPVPEPDPTADYDPNSPPPELITRSEQDYPSNSEVVTDSDGNPILDPDGNPIIDDVPIGLDFDDFINEASQVQQDTQVETRVTDSQQLLDELARFERLIQERFALSGQRKELPAAYIPLEPEPIYTGPAIPTVGLTDLAIGYSAPRFSSLLVSDVINASEIGTELRNTAGFRNVLDLNINQVISKVAFLAFADTTSELTGQLPSFIDAREDRILELVQGSFALNTVSRSVGFVQSDVGRALLLNLVGRNRVTGRLFNTLGDDLAFFIALVNTTILSQALLQVAGVFPPQFILRLIEGIPALRDFLGEGVLGGVDTNKLQGRVQEVLSNVGQTARGGLRESLINRINDAAFGIPGAGIAAAKNSEIVGERGQIPTVWSASSQKGYNLYILPREIVKKNLLNDSILADTSEPPPPPFPPELPQPVDTTPTFNPLAAQVQQDVLQDSIEQQEILSDSIRNELIQDGLVEASVLNSQLRSDAINRQARNDAIGDDIADSAINSARLDAEIANEDALDYSLDQQRAEDDFLESQIVSQLVNQDDLLDELINRDQIQSDELREEQDEKFLEVSRLTQEELEKNILNGEVITDAVMRSALQNALEILGINTRTATRIAGNVGFEGADEDAIKEQELQQSIIADQERRESILRDHQIFSERIRQRQKDHVERVEENRRRRRTAINQDILNFQILFDHNMRAILKSSYEDRLRDLADQFRDLLKDMLVEEPRLRAQTDPTARAIYYLAGGTDAITPEVTRGIDINI